VPASDEATSVLIVEDDQSTAAQIRRVLEKYGYRVAGIASSGHQALEMSAAQHPNIVLMDILLGGGMDGVATAQLIGGNFQIPIIYLTSYADERTLQRAKITAPHGFVMKPFDELQLHAAIQMALSRSMTERESQEAGAAFTILKDLVDAVIVTDEKGSVTFMNPAAEKLTGWDAKEAHAKLWTDVFNIIKEMPGALGDSSITTGLHDSAILITRDQARTAVEYTATLMKNEQGINTGFTFVFRDVTRHRHFEMTMAESRKKYKELVNSIEGVVWEADENRQFTFVSKQAQKLLGYPAESWLNEPSFWKDHIHPDDRDWATNFCQKAIAERKDVELEYRMIHTDTRTVWIREILNAGLDSKS
jgi:PAS domain S-box-containing protein